MPTRLIASSIALIAFVIALVMGIVAGNHATHTLLNAIGALAACYVLGLIVAAVAQRAIDEHIESYQRAHPLPEENQTDTTQISTEPAGETAGEPVSSADDHDRAPDQPAAVAA